MNIPLFIDEAGSGDAAKSDASADPSASTTNHSSPSKHESAEPSNSNDVNMASSEPGQQSDLQGDSNWILCHSVILGKN